MSELLGDRDLSALAALAASDEQADAPPAWVISELFPELSGVSLIGRGGMGAVYRVTTKAGQVAALKVIAPELAGDPRFDARFRREARALGAVEHSGIVEVIEVGEREGVPYLLMDHVDGPSLRDQLEADERPLEAVLGWVADIAEALEAMHAAGLVHRDLKPDNVLLDAAGRAVLIDFGLARDQAPQSALTQTRMLMGTPAYVAPELWSDARQASPASDVYALGVVFHELVLGELPSGAFEAPRRKGLEPRLGRLCAAMLGRDPAARPTAAAVARQLSPAAQVAALQRATALLMASTLAVMALWVSGSSLTRVAVLPAAALLGWASWVWLQTPSRDRNPRNAGPAARLGG